MTTHHRPLPLRALAVTAGCLLLAACGDPEPGCPAAADAGGLLLTASLDFETGGLAVFDPGDPAAVCTKLVTAGDAALRVADGRVVILSRGQAGNVLVLDRDLAPSAQIALPGCNPHDMTALGADELLVTCYDDTHMRRVDLAARHADEVIDLSAFADADGIPEMDQLAVSGGRLYVTVERLDRDAAYAPTGNGLLVEVDPERLEVIDADAEQPGLQAYELPAEDPYTPIVKLPDGSLVVGCAGYGSDQARMGIVRFDPLTAAAEMLVSGAALGGMPSDLAACGGAIYALVAAPDGWSTEEMRALRIDGAEPRLLRASPGFTLAGLACDEDGHVYVGDRSTDDNAGLWVIDEADGEQQGPYNTGLPPVEIEIL